VLIDTANTSKKITSELQPSGAGTTARFNLVHDDGGLPAGDFLGKATRDQIAQHGVQLAGKPVALTAQFAVSTRPQLQHTRLIILSDRPQVG